MDESSVAELRQRMGQVRAELLHDSQQLRENAQALSDWRYYVRRYPWVALAASAAIGFLLVPKRRAAPAADAETIAKLIREHQLEVRPPAASPGLLQSAMSTLGSTLLRAGVTYLGHQLGQVVSSAAAGAAAGAQAASARQAGPPVQQPADYSPLSPSPQ